ncbi:MAG: hypothetical protein ACTIKR_20550, partial [Advenella sp.]|uniref:hypothetical protein n=1 Tax=Advenella sp. TaxID=1872388 RepID=UPI003F9B24FB
DKRKFESVGCKKISVPVVQAARPNPPTPQLPEYKCRQAELAHARRRRRRFDQVPFSSPNIACFVNVSMQWR